jgi:hypothetical protein
MFATGESPIPSGVAFRDVQTAAISERSAALHEQPPPIVLGRRAIRLRGRQAPQSSMKSDTIEVLIWERKSPFRWTRAAALLPNIG